MNNRYYEWSMAVLRIVLGIIFLAHGLQKITGFQGIVQFFGSIGLPAIVAYVVTAIETVGGICLILGLFTRAAAAGIACVIIGAIVSLKAAKGFLNGYEYDLLILAAATALMLSGSHTFSLGDIVTRKTGSKRAV